MNTTNGKENFFYNPLHCWTFQLPVAGGKGEIHTRSDAKSAPTTHMTWTYIL